MRMLRRLAERLRKRSSFRDGRICAITLGIAVLPLLAFMPGGGAQPPPSIATIVEFNTVCSDRHAGECSGRLSFDSEPAAARAHISRIAFR